MKGGGGGGGSCFRCWDCESIYQKGEKLIRYNPLAHTPKYPNLSPLLLLRRARGDQAYYFLYSLPHLKKIRLFINPHQCIRTRVWLCNQNLLRMFFERDQYHCVEGNF